MLLQYIYVYIEYSPLHKGFSSFTDWTKKTFPKQIPSFHTSVAQTQKKKLQKKTKEYLCAKVCAKSLRVFKTGEEFTKKIRYGYAQRLDRGLCVSELKCFIKIMCAHHHLFIRGAPHTYTLHTNKTKENKMLDTNFN